MKESYIFEYVNENEFRKYERSLKKYNMLAYKKLYFSYYPSFKEGTFLGEIISFNEGSNSKSFEFMVFSNIAEFSDSIIFFCNSDLELIKIERIFCSYSSASVSATVLDLLYKRIIIFLKSNWASLIYLIVDPVVLSKHSIVIFVFISFRGEIC